MAPKFHASSELSKYIVTVFFVEIQLMQSITIFHSIIMVHQYDTPVKVVSYGTLRGHS